MTRETLCWMILSVHFHIPLPILYKPSLPMKIVRTRSFSKKLLREKTIAKHLRVRDCIPTIIYTIFSKVSFTPTSLSTHLWEVLSPNTYLTQFECWEKFWYIWEALKEAIEWRMQFGTNCRIRTTSKDIDLWNPLIAGTWKIQVHWVD